MARFEDIGEFEAIRRLIASRPAVAGAVVPSGDDAAVLRPEPGLDLAVTTDAFVEGRHWRPEWISPPVLGARLATANLSDLAAMAARPRWAVVSYGLRPEHDVDDLLALDAGLAQALAHDGAGLVGGNFSAVDGSEWLGLTLIGACEPGRAWTRGGAREGDWLAVAGAPGRAGAGLALAQRLGPPNADAWWAPLFEAWQTPRARVGLALALATTGAVHAAIDVSDGFGSDLLHLCDASGVGVEIDAKSWPDDAVLERAGRELGVSIDDLRLGASDDYELILAIAPEMRSACEAAAREKRIPLTFVGRVTGGARTWIERGGAERALPRSGWDHFSRR